MKINGIGRILVIIGLYRWFVLLFLILGLFPFLLAQQGNEERTQRQSPKRLSESFQSPLSGSNVQSATLLLQEAVLRLEQTQYQAAAQATRTYLLLYPKHYRVAEANFYRAVAIYHLGNVEEARNIFNGILAAKPQEARRFGALYWLGLTSYRLGDWDIANDSWLSQLAIRRTHSADYIQPTYLALAQLMSDRGDETAALRYYRLLEGRTKLRAGFAHGSLALRRGLYREAYNAFSAYLAQQDVETGPSRAQAVFYQGQSAFFASLFPQAKLSLDTVLRLYERSDRFFLASLIMRVRIALAEQEDSEAIRFYDEAKVIEARYRHGMKDWLHSMELPLLLVQGQPVLALRYLRKKLAQSRGLVDREIARFNMALALAFVDVRQAIKQLQKMEKSLTVEIRERALFHMARLQISFPLTRSDGLASMERYLEQYPEGVYLRDAARMSLKVYRGDPERFWLPASVMLDRLTSTTASTGSWALSRWSQVERARFFLYWAEMARQLGNHGVTLKYLHQSWGLVPRQLVGLQAYYRIGVIYFNQRQYFRALGYFREVQLQLAGLNSAVSEPVYRGEVRELNFYNELAIAQSYAGAGQTNKALQQFEQLIQKSRDTPQGNVEQTRLQLGLVYFYQRAYEQAVDTFDSVISDYGVLSGNLFSGRYPPVMLALYWKGEALFRQGLFAAARQSFYRVNEIFPEALEGAAYLRAALAARAAGDYTSVLDDLLRAKKLMDKDNVTQLLNIDFHLVKYNLILGRDMAALEAAKHMLQIAPPAHNFLGESFLQVAELHFNRGEFKRSKELLQLLETKFIRRLSRRNERALKEKNSDRNLSDTESLEQYLQEQSPTRGYLSDIMVDRDLRANIESNLFSFDAEQFLRRYNHTPINTATGNKGGNSNALDENLRFYLQRANSPSGSIAANSSIFSALYLQGLIYAEERDLITAFDYFMQYLQKDALGPYAVSAASSILRIMPQLLGGTGGRALIPARRLYFQLKNARLGEPLNSVMLVRYWALQTESKARKRALENIIKQSLSISARKEAMYHLALHYRKDGQVELATKLLMELRDIRGIVPADNQPENQVNSQFRDQVLDPQNYWTGLANLELGRTAYRQGQISEAEIFFQAIISQPQVERETLAEAFYWLAIIAHGQGNTQEHLRYRNNLQNLAPESSWIRKLN